MEEEELVDRGTGIKTGETRMLERREEEWRKDQKEGRKE